jgi:hypothetical protein
VVALLTAGAAALLTPSVALVQTIHEGTRRSLIESGAGHLQVYHSASPQVPQMVTGPGGPPELVPLEDYASTEAFLRTVEEVQEVVPLEVGRGAVFRGNYLDEKLAAVRAVAREQPSEARNARLARLAGNLRRTLERFAQNERQRDDAFGNELVFQEDRRFLEHVLSDGFWAQLLAEPLPALELIENRVSWLAGEGESITLDYLGTDLPQFDRAFPRFELVSGQLPPAGSRGLVMGHALYEQSFKLPIATRLDEVHRARQQGRTLAEDEGLRTQVARSVTEIPDLLARVDEARSAALSAVLERALGHSGPLEKLLEEFLTLDDGNFDARYPLFYAELAPLLPMYRIQPGDTLSLRNLAKTGTGVPVRVWGTFRFSGLGGDSSRVNSTSLLDLVTARQLAERDTRAQQQEARELIEALGMPGLEEGGGEDLGPLTIVDVEPVKGAGEAPVIEREELPETFTEDEVKSGSVLQAALVLRPDAEPAQVAERIARLAGERKLPLATANWEAVGGMLGGVVKMGQVLLLLLALLLSGFVLLLSTGTLLLLAKERVGEVGTLRAIGMQRREVFFTLLTEGLVLGGVGSVLGAVLGAVLLMAVVGQGVAVKNEALQFFLGGTVLQPQLQLWHGGVVVLGLLGVVLGASLVPAWRGSAVAPVVAMSRRGD